MSDAVAAMNPAGRSLGRVLVIDDEGAMGRILVRALAADGYAASAYADPLRALAAVPAEQPDVIVTDLRMPGAGGREVLERVRAEYPEIPVIVMTAHGTIEDAVAMIRAGAFNFITKPFQHAALLQQIELALRQKRLEQENTRLAEASGTAAGARPILGDSEAARKLRATIARAASSGSIVLVTGESGTGKELAALEIHRQSPRVGRRFVAVNCPAIPASLIESELFGHERGAFTGADRSKMGLIELSAGGTLFLDEIGELPPEPQAKLLRVLQEREIQRVGGLRQIPVDIRIVAATNRDLEREVRENRFRMDLYYRLNVLTLEVPPLRERTGDIPELAAHFLNRLSRRLGRPGLSLDPSALPVLMAYRWPGNIRELENTLERMAVLSSKTVFGAADLPPGIGGGGPSPEAEPRTPAPAPAPSEGDPPVNYREAKEQFERAYLRRILQASGGNVARAARMSGVSRRNFYEKFEKLGLDTRELRAEETRDSETGPGPRD